MNKGIIIYDATTGKVYGTLFNSDMSINCKSMYIELSGGQSVTEIDVSGEKPNAVIINNDING